jgi:predicted amidophosphoribosyltransferase
MVVFPKECKDCELEGCWPHSYCDGCKDGSKYLVRKTCNNCKGKPYHRAYSPCRGCMRNDQYYDYNDSADPLDNWKEMKTDG